MAKPVMLDRLKKGEVFVVMSQHAFATLKGAWVDDRYRVKVVLTSLMVEGHETIREYHQARLGVAMLFLNRAFPVERDRVQGWISAASEADLRLLAVEGAKKARSRPVVPSSEMAGALHDDL